MRRCASFRNRRRVSYGELTKVGSVRNALECSGKPPVIEVRTPLKRIDMFRRRGDADRMTRPHIEFGQESIQEPETLYASNG